MDGLRWGMVRLRSPWVGLLTSSWVRTIGVGVIAGGISALAIRIWTEQVSQTSPSQLSGLGDLDFSSTGMGDYVQTPYSLPSVTAKNASGQYVVQNPWPAALPQLRLPRLTKATGAARAWAGSR